MPGSSDDTRGHADLAHLRTERFDQGMDLALGGRLDEVVCAFEMYGKLNGDRSNAVLVCHAISGDSHVARHGPDDPVPGWWEALVGPGQPIDTDRYCVICPNVLGGCRGTTGPTSLNPATGEPFGPDFPDVTLADMVDLQAMLLDRLGIETLHAVVGGSLGGQQAMTWATRYPTRVTTCCAIATSPRLGSQALAFDVVARNAIQRDPEFHDGHYYGKPTGPDVGLAIARMLGHITYLSAEAMDAKFDPDRHQPHDIVTAFEKRFSVGSYLAHQGQKFVARFDANSYVRLSMAMDLFDLGRDPASLRQTLAKSTCDWLVVSFSSDWLFTPGQSRQIVDALVAEGRSVGYAEITTDAGHDAFLLPSDIQQYAPLVQARLQGSARAQALRVEVSPAEEVILGLIPKGASVLDLGCGEGRLLAGLRQRGHHALMGVEVAQDKLIAASALGLDVLDFDLNTGLPAFGDGQFDVVVLSATLQAIADVGKLVDEMLRVGDRVVIGFSNFAYRELREMLYREGRSPKAPGDYDYDWWDTPNRRFPSIADFEDFCVQRNVVIHDSVFLDTATGSRIDPKDNPNLNADLAFMVMSRG